MILNSLTTLVAIIDIDAPISTQTFKQGLLDFNYQMQHLIVVNLVDEDLPNGWCWYDNNNLSLNYFFIFFSFG
jgi:hypothetical protein